MTRLNSFYLSPILWPQKSNDIVVLSGNEARHMLTVLRTETNSTVRLFDGVGNIGIFRLTKKSKKDAQLEPLELFFQERDNSGLTLAIGWGKSNRRNYLFEKAVELNTDGIAFWTACRSQGRPSLNPKESWADKCIQAAKQCGATHLPKLTTLAGLQELIEFSADFDQTYVAWESQSITAKLTPQKLCSGKQLIVIGPEGGLEDSEAKRLITSGFIPVTLGNSILRWETAATYCMSLSFYAQQGTDETSD